METEPGQKTTGSAERVLEVAKQQKRLIWLILVQLISGILFMSIGLSDGSPLWLLVSVILGIICAYLVYKIGRGLELSTVQLVITIVILFVPFIGLLSLLYINTKATKFLQEAGVEVGFMGAKRKSMGEILELE